MVLKAKQNYRWKLSFTILIFYQRIPPLSSAECWHGQVGGRKAYVFLSSNLSKNQSNIDGRTSLNQSNTNGDTSQGSCLVVSWCYNILINQSNTDRGTSQRSYLVVSWCCNILGNLRLMEAPLNDHTLYLSPNILMLSILLYKWLVSEFEFM